MFEERKEKVFPQCFYRVKNGFSTVTKKVASTTKKEVFPQLFYSESKGVSMVTVFSTVKKGLFSQGFYGEKSVSTVFPWWCFHLENKRCLATVISLNGTS